MKISIITAAYNAGEYIEQMIDSVLTQTADFELIIVDDGSTDDTCEKVEKYSIKDERIKLINAQHGGAGHARNVGIDAATGDWIIFLDSDDLLVSNSLNSELTYALSNNLWGGGTI